VRGKGSQLGYAAVILGDPNRVTTDLARKLAVTADEVLAAAKNVLREDRRITVVVRPDPNPPPAEEATDKGRPPEKLVDLPAPETMPKPVSPKPVDLRPPTTRTLSNGMRVMVLSERSLPEITMSFNMLAGARCDPDEQAGLAAVTAATLRRGTKQHSGDELAKLIDLHAMSLGDNVDQEDGRIQIWALSQDADLAAKTLAEAVREPTFPDNEVSEYVTRAVAREKVAEQDPATIASRAFSKALYGRNYLGRQTGGTSKTLPAIPPAAVRAFHESHYASNIATFMVTGDIAPDAAFALAEKYFGDWKSNADVQVTSPAPPVTPRQILLVDRPGAVQSEIRIGQIVPVSRKDKDYPAVRLLSQAFGESFGARLNRVLRIEMGLTYGARGAFNVDTGAAALSMSTFTRTDKTAVAVEAALGEVRKLTDGLVTPEELRQCRDSLIGKFQMALETPAQTAARYWDLIVWGLPENWYSEFLRAVERVDDPASMTETARRVLKPDQMLVVVVGNGEKIREELTKIAPVTSMPADEPAVPGKQAASR
jgi:zinc protease